MHLIVLPIRGSSGKLCCTGRTRALARREGLEDGASGAWMARAQIVEAALFGVRVAALRLGSGCRQQQPGQEESAAPADHLWLAG